MDEIYEQIEKEETLRITNVVVRFILKYKTRRHGQYFEQMKTTTDYDELKKLLSSGGYNHDDGDFELYELIGAEVVS
jgi:hypothetical protein